MIDHTLFWKIYRSSELPALSEYEDLEINGIEQNLVLDAIEASLPIDRWNWEEEFRHLYTTDSSSPGWQGRVLYFSRIPLVEWEWNHGPSKKGPEEGSSYHDSTVRFRFLVPERVPGYVIYKKHPRQCLLPPLRSDPSSFMKLIRHIPQNKDQVPLEDSQEAPNA